MKSKQLKSEPVVVNGCVVPFVKVTKLPKGYVNITIDERFGHAVKRDQAHGLCWLLANAMAVAAGYTEHGVGMIPKPDSKQNRDYRKLAVLVEP